MPKFDLPARRSSDLAAFLHQAIYQNSNRRLYKILDIVVGDAKAGQAYFNGAGRCSSCHSPTGDLKGVGAKYEPATLQGRLLLPRGRERPAGSPPVPLYADPTALKVTVTPPSGETVIGRTRPAHRLRSDALRRRDRPRCDRGCATARRRR